jgi:phage head maturation protease
MPTLYGRFASFKEWTEIRSAKEGHFLERISPGAFEKTINENRKSLRVLFHHGQDPAIGYKVLGPIQRLDGDTSYEVPLLDTDYNRSLVPGLKAGLYGASFRFTVAKDEHVPHPRRSDWNPQGIPEVTITEAQVIEFGPTPLPAYKGATAGVRSTRELVRELHSSAYALGLKERWATRTKPGCPGTYQRERVYENERASWESRPEDAWWWLEESQFTPLPAGSGRMDWYLR